MRDVCALLAPSDITGYDVVMDKHHHGLWHTIREYATHWTIAGAFLAATGAAPEHWVAEFFHELHFPIGTLPPWFEHVDYRLVAVVVGLSIIVGDSLWRHHGRNSTVSAETTGAAPALEKLSIAVLPFINMSGDPDQEYFSDGITEEIITALSRMRWFFVIARNSSFSYKTQAVDVKQIGRDLGVHYVLEGSVRLSERHVRITAQLIEAETGVHLWADRYDGVLEDIFDFQDKVTESVAFAIEPQIRSAEVDRAKRRRPDSLTAYDLYLRGVAQFYTTDVEGNEATLRLMQQAIARDPNFGPPYAISAICYVYRLTQGWTSDIQQDRLIGMQMAHAAVKHTDDDPTVLAIAAQAIGYLGETDQAIALMERSLKINPFSSAALLLGGWVQLYAGNPDAAIDSFTRGIRLSPLDVRLDIYYSGLAYALIMAERPKEGAEWAEKAVVAGPGWLTGYRALAAALAAQGRVVEAQTPAKHMMKLFPDFTITKGMVPYKQGEASNRLSKALLAAGFPP